MSDKTRCRWARTALSIPYHDNEWGTPHRDDRHLFEMLCLEGAQAGLSWETILAKRVAYRELFDNFEPSIVAAYSSEKIAELLLDARIVRNRAKVASTVKNAAAFLAVQAEFGSFAHYLWKYVDNTPIVNRREPDAELPATTELSDHISRDLKRRGFSFVGSTIIYAYMQAVGVVDDHQPPCFRTLAH